MALSNTTMKDPASFLLTPFVWTKVLESDNSRKFVSIDNEHATYTARWQFPYRNNPFAYDFNGSNIAITPILTAPNTWASATRGKIVIRFYLDDAPTGTDTLISFGDTNANEVLRLYIDSSRQIVGECIDGGTTQWKFTADNAITAEQWYVLEFFMSTPRENSSTTVAPFIRLNGGGWPVTFNTSTDTDIFMSSLAGADNAYIGADSFNSAGITNFFDGKIDFVVIIEEDTVGGNIQPVQVCNYPLTAGTGTTAADIFQHGDDATITQGAGGWIPRSDGNLLRANTRVSLSIKDCDYDIRNALWAYTEESAHELTIRQGKEEVQY